MKMTGIIIFLVAVLLIGASAWVVKLNRKPKSLPITYVLHSGEVRNFLDGDWQYISVEQLARLYKLKKGTWMSHQDAQKRGKVPTEHILHLYPRDADDYKEHLQVLKAFAQEVFSKGVAGNAINA